MNMTPTRSHNTKQLNHNEIFVYVAISGLFCVDCIQRSSETEKLEPQPKFYFTLANETLESVIRAGSSSRPSNHIHMHRV